MSDQWQPIETVPKGHGPDGFKARRCCFGGTMKFYSGGIVGTAKHVYQSTNEDPPGQPTHWMPLPEPPQA